MLGTPEPLMSWRETQSRSAPRTMERVKRTARAAPSAYASTGAPFRQSVFIHESRVLTGYCSTLRNVAWVLRSLGLWGNGVVASHQFFDCSMVANPVFFIQSRTQSITYVFEYRYFLLLHQSTV